MEIETKLQEVFRDVFQDESLTILPEMTAGDVDKWDSITHLIMISKVEEVFNVQLTIFIHREVFHLNYPAWDHIFRQILIKPLCNCIDFGLFHKKN